MGNPTIMLKYLFALTTVWLTLALNASPPAYAQCTGVPGANLICASPNGASGPARFRAQVAADMPGSGTMGGSLTGTFPNPTIANSAISNAMLATGTFANITGLGTVTSGTLNGLTITGLANPSGATDAANKQYVDLATAGVTVHTPVIAATAAILSNTPTYSNGSSGVGATLTAGSNGALTIDGHVVVNGERVLVKNQVAGLQNGVYTQTTLGTAGVAYVLTRATDMDTVGSGTGFMETGASFLATSGSANVGGNFILTTPATITIGTTALTFNQNGVSQVYSAGTGLTLIGTTFSITAPVTVALGGTGATTLTGLLQGNGTGAITGLSGTSGGVPYFSAAATLASSGALTANGLVLGGGAGSAPTAMARLTTGQIPIGQASGVPVGAVLSGDVVNVASGVTTIQNNAVTNAKMATAAAVTLKGNPTSGTANVQDFTIGGLSAIGTPDANLDLLLIYNHTTGTFNYVTPFQVATSSVAGVSSLGTQVGAITCAATLTCSGNSIGVANLGIANAQIANATINLTTKVTGILPPANGGTGAAALGAGLGFLLSTGVLQSQTGHYYPQCDTTGAVDCSSTIQTSINACEAAKGGAVELQPGTILVDAGVTLSGGCSLSGAGWMDYSGFFTQISPSTVGPNGTYLKQTHAGHAAPAISVANTANHAYIYDLAFIQEQPADSGGWSPFIYNSSIQLFGNNGGSVLIERVMFWGVYQGIYGGEGNNFIGRTDLKHIWGACFTSCIRLNTTGDTTKIDDVHAYPYFYTVGRNNVAAYMLANSESIVLARVDGLQASNIFGLGQANCLHITSQSTGGAGTGTATYIQVSNMYCDASNTGIKIDGSSVTNKPTLFVSNYAYQWDGASAGGNGIYVNQDGAVVFVTNAKISNSPLACIDATGGNTDVTVVNVFCEAWNQSGTGIQGLHTGNPTDTMTVGGRMKGSPGSGSPTITGGLGTNNNSHAN